MNFHDTPALAVSTLATRRFTAHPATKDNICAYGTLLEPIGDGVAFGPLDAALQISQGTPRFYLMKLTKRSMAVTRITRHLAVTQALAALNGKRWYILLAPPDEPDNPQALPNVDRLQAFCITGTQALVLHRSTWHAGPYFLEDEVDFVDRKSTRLNSSHRNTSRMPSSA